MRNKKWLSHKNDKTGRLEVEIHLAKAIKIGFINVGNAGSGFIELLVGNSMWSAGSTYVSFLPSTVLMSPNDSKLAQNTECVKMLNKDSFIKNVSDQEWDRIRVICRQPFNKEKQFGLQFIDFIADDKLANENQHGKECNATPKQTLAQFRRRNILSPKRNQSTPGCLLSSPTTPLNRAASILQLAAQKGKEKPIPKKPSPTQHQRRSTSINQKRTNSSPNTVSAGSQRRKTQSRSSAGDIEDEVECFFEAIDFDKIPLESITYRQLLEQIEKQRGCEFTKAEKKIFLALAKRFVSKVLAKREEPKEKKLKSSNSPPTCIDIPSQSAVVISSPKSDETMVECPMCERFFLQTIIEAHASICSDSAVQEETADTSDDNCWFPGKYTAKTDTDKIEVQPRRQLSSVDLDSTEPSVSCPICHGLYPVSRITVHANICVEINPSTIVL